MNWPPSFVPGWRIGEAIPIRIERNLPHFPIDQGDLVGGEFPAPAFIDPDLVFSLEIRGHTAVAKMVVLIAGEEEFRPEFQTDEGAEGADKRFGLGDEILIKNGQGIGLVLVDEVQKPA
jgi:hypothetical protein